DRRDPRQVCNRYAAAGLDWVEPEAPCACDPHGARLAVPRTNVAPPVLRPRDAQADSSRYGAVTRRARRTPRVLRSAPDGIARARGDAARGDIQGRGGAALAGWKDRGQTTKRVDWSYPKGDAQRLSFVAVADGRILVNALPPQGRVVIGRDPQC